MEAYQPKTQSILFKDWVLLGLCEFSQNKILATTTGNCMFIILDFSVVKFLDGKHYDDILKIRIQPFPSFDEDTFPFLLVLGCKSLSIVNVRDGFHQPLIDQ